MTTTTAPRTWYSVKGSTQDVTECGICGRTDLRKTVKLMAIEDGMEMGLVYAGVDCAARLTGDREHEMKQRVANADRAARGIRNRY